MEVSFREYRRGYPKWGTVPARVPGNVAEPERLAGGAGPGDVGRGGRGPEARRNGAFEVRLAPLNIG